MTTAVHPIFDPLPLGIHLEIHLEIQVPFYVPVPVPLAKYKHPAFSKQNQMNHSA